MLIQENIIIEGQEFIKTYSDINKYILQNETGIEYVDAVDVPDTYTYTETNKDIPIRDEVIEDDSK